MDLAFYDLWDTLSFSETSITMGILLMMELLG